MRASHALRTLALLAAVATATPVTARAAEPSSVEQLEAEAVAAYEAGDFDEAASLFEQAFDASGDPNLLYNAGRVYEEAGKLEKAIEYYERFVHAEGVGLDTRVVASERLSQLKKIVGNDAEPDDADATPDEAAAPPEPTPADDGGKPPSKTMVIAGSVLVGVGAPVALAGAVLGGLALRNNDRLETQELDDPSAAQRNGQRQALAADIMVPLGSVLAVTGISLLVVNAVRKAKASENRAALTPSISRGHAGFVLQGRF